MSERPKKDLTTLKWTPELSGRFWNGLAGSSFLAQIAFSRFAAPYLVELVRPYFSGDPEVLDYGSGWNLYLVRELVRQGYRTAFYEPSVPAEEQVEDLLADPRFLGPVRKLEAGRFGAAFFSEVIEHLTNEEIAAVLPALTASLAADGVLVVTTPHNENLFEQSRYCPTCEHLFHPWGHVRAFSPEALEQLLAQYGLRCEAVWNVDFSSTREAGEELVAVKDRIARLLEELEQVRPRRWPFSNEAAALAQRIRSDFADLADQRDRREPSRRRIGFGGTIVAVARKA